MRITTYIEGVESWGQALCRPLTICCGSSYNKDYRKFKPNLLSKISLVALAIIFFPVSVPLIALGCLLIHSSKEHKKQFTLICYDKKGHEFLKSISFILRVANAPYGVGLILDPLEKQEIEDRVVDLGKKLLSDEEHNILHLKKRWEDTNDLITYIEKLPSLFKADLSIQMYLTDVKKIQSLVSAQDFN